MQGRSRAACYGAAPRNVVPVMAMGVADLKRELTAEGGLSDFPEIHQFLDGFYLSRIGIRILIGQHIALHEPQKENHIGALLPMLIPCTDVDAVSTERGPMFQKLHSMKHGPFQRTMLTMLLKCRGSRMARFRDLKLVACENVRFVHASAAGCTGGRLMLLCVCVTQA